LDRSCGLQAVGDLHASAPYRQHLARVLLCRCVASLNGESIPLASPLAPALHSGAGVQAPAQELPVEGFGDVQLLQGKPSQVWHALLDPAQLRASIPGCESLVQHSEQDYEATIKVGLGPLSVRFKSQVQLRDLKPFDSLTLIFHGQAGALGSGEGRALVRLEALPEDQTRLHWWVHVQLGGRLAQFGNRLIEATARQLSAQFFASFAQALSDPAETLPAPTSRPLSWWARVLQLFSPSKRM
jgi:carbon monoxide dehydrogenase subunit G